MFNTYKVLDGEKLDDIASKFNVSAQELMDINNIYFPDKVRAGMDLVVPSNDIYYNVYTIEKGDSLYKISEKFNVNPKLLASLNGLNADDYIYPNQEILIPRKDYSYYITAKGDTIETVSDTFGVDSDVLLKQNPTIYLMEEQVLVVKRR